MEFPYHYHFVDSFENLYKNIQEELKHGALFFKRSNYKYLNNDLLLVVPFEKYFRTDVITNIHSERIRIYSRESGKPSPYESWNTLVDNERDKLMSLSIKERREYLYSICKGCNLFNITYMCAIIYYASSKFLKGQKVRILDACAGWGDRLISSCIMNIDEYVGYETNDLLNSVYEDTYNSCFRANPNCKTKFNGLINVPFENSNETSKYSIVFASPPFEDKEIYQGELTSTKRYNSREEWYDKFYAKLIDNCKTYCDEKGVIVLYIPYHMYEFTKQFFKDYNCISLSYASSFKGKIGPIRTAYIFNKK